MLHSTQGRSAAEQRDAVIAGFPSVPPWFRRLFPYSKWGAELNARITPAFFTWLVGPMETIEVEVVAPDGTSSTQRSGVQIERCRYLEESGCVGMCVNLCKAPTQTFFTRELGMPLYMEPNFDDLSCRMVFGQAAPPLEEDPVTAQQPCLAGCSTATAGSGKRCHKLD